MWLSLKRPVNRRPATRKAIMNLEDVFKHDQDDEPIKQLGRMLGVYYKSLVESGIPIEVAAIMIEDYHWTTFCCGTYKETGVFPPRS